MGWWAWGCLGLAAVVSGRAIAAPATAQTSPDTIAIAVSLTGPNTYLGQPSIEGATLAVEETNAANPSAPIKLATYDETSDPAHSGEIAHQVAASNAAIVIGPSATPIALVAAPVYAASGIVALGTIVTGDSVTENATFFRTSFSTSDGGESLANYLHYILGGRSAIMLFKDDGYGRPAAEGFRRGADRLGIATSFLSFTTVEQAEAPAHQAAADPNHPAIILGMINEAGPVLKVLRRDGAAGPIIGTNALASEAFLASFANEPEDKRTPGFFTNGVYAASSLIFDSANATTLAFAERYRARFGREPNYISVHGYEAALLAIAGVRATAGDAGDLKARRKAIFDYLKTLDGPARAISGLNGPLWFTPEKGRLQALRMGRFEGSRFESARAQLVPVANFDPGEIASSAVVDIGGGRFARHQKIVYSGVYLNDVPRVDIAQSTFTADFYLWVRYAHDTGAGAADPTEIDFPDLVRGTFDATRPTRQGDLADGTTYRLWRVRGDFKNDFDLHRYPFDQQHLAIRFFNARADSTRISYVLDLQSSGTLGNAILGLSEGDEHTGVPGAPSFANVAPGAFHNLTQWEPVHANQRRDDLVTQSALGDPRLVGLDRVLELSGFRVGIDLRRHVVTTLAKTLLPLGLLTLIMFASLFFPVALVKEKITLAITAALSGAVLLAAINAQLGGVGYVIAVEYVFYIFFTLCLLCILSVLAAERFRVVERETAALVAEQTIRYVFALGVAATVTATWVITSRW
jgi:branched-chain amino acid transport system substrate-binding protein